MSIASSRTVSGQLGVRLLADVAPMIGRGPQPPGGGVGQRHVAVAEDLELPVIVGRDHRLGEEIDGMVAKIGRHIADRAGGGRACDRWRAVRPAP